MPSRLSASTPNMKTSAECNEAVDLLKKTAQIRWQLREDLSIGRGRPPKCNVC
jgi:hypothetical protein